MCVCQIERETGEIESATIRREIKDGATIKQIVKNKTERESEREKRLNPNSCTILGKGEIFDRECDNKKDNLRWATIKHVLKNKREKKDSTRIAVRFSKWAKSPKKKRIY